MASKKNKARAAKEQTTRKFKKKTSILLIEDIEYVDFKDVDLLNRFVSDRAKIRNRRVTGNNLQQQREVANAVKIAREMALIPYSKRVSSQRTRPPRGEGRGDRGDRGDRGERREPRTESTDKPNTRSAATTSAATTSAGATSAGATSAATKSAGADTAASVAVVAEEG